MKYDAKLTATLITNIVLLNFESSIQAYSDMVSSRKYDAKLTTTLITNIISLVLQEITLATAQSKTTELIDALCAKRADDDQTNAIFWLVDALKQSNSVDTHAIITKV